MTEPTKPTPPEPPKADTAPTPPVPPEKPKKVEEIGGPPGPEPTRYGDWQFKRQGDRLLKEVGHPEAQPKDLAAAGRIPRYARDDTREVIKSP